MPALCPPEDLALDLVVIMLLPVDLEPETLSLRKWGKKQPLRDSRTLSFYGIVDGSALDVEVVGFTSD